MRRMLAASALLLALSGCETFEFGGAPAPEEAAYVGLGRSALIACAGEPDRTRGSGDGFEVLTYETGERYRGADLEYDNTTLGSFQSPLAEDIRSDYCEARFTISGGVVTDVRFSTPAGFGSRRYSNCSTIVAACRGTGAVAPAAEAQ